MGACKFLMIFWISSLVVLVSSKFVWQRVATSKMENLSATSPGPRYYSGFGFDLMEQKAIVFGGIDQAGNTLGDTWIFDAAINGIFSFLFFIKL